MKWLALVLLATTALADETLYKRGDGVMPFPFAPTATAFVVRFKHAPGGGFVADHFYTQRGTVAEVCESVQDGLCCPCNERPDGKRPECGWEVWNSPASTTGGCSQKVWPNDSYEPPLNVGPWASGKALAKKRDTGRVYVAGIIKRHGKRYPTKMR